MEVQNIPIGEVHPSPMNPRKTIDEDALQELADNIRQQGLIQPITIRPRVTDEIEPGSGEVVTIPFGYEIVCGERRYRAMCKLNAEDPERWPTIASIVREMADDEAYDAMITENLQRRDVDPIEEAFAFSQLIERGNTAEEIALRFGKSIRFVQDRVKLNYLIPELILKVREGTMPIAAGMIICKFEEDAQRKFLSAYGNYAKITKDHATSFLNQQFMMLQRAPWYQSDNQEDEDFEGGCDRKCAECPLNTANANCLFWEMKADDDGKCTDRTKFEAKHRAYLFHYLGGIADELVKKGEALEYGKTVIVDTANCWNAEAQRIHGDVVAGIEERGFEIVKPDIFRNRVYYSASDERIPEMLKNGECYRCIDVFGNGELPAPKVAHYRIKPITKDAPVTPGEVAPPEAVKLVGQFKRNTEICNEKLCKCNQEMARDLGPTKRRGPLKEKEQLGFDMFILSQLNSDFFAKYYNICKSSGMRPTVQELTDIAKGNADDRDLWYREYVRTKMSEGFYPGSLSSRVCGDILRLWMPDKVQEEGMKIINSTEKKNEKIKQRLEELGYDQFGKKLVTPEKKPEPVKSATAAEAEVLSQYREMKKKHKDVLLLFRVGNNYIAIKDDAAKVFEVTLAGLDDKKIKGETVSICKFPADAIETILPKLVRAGNRVATCEQLKDPKKKK